jgi:glycine/D-amino acid oxidase-like deaminating enzyme
MDYIAYDKLPAIGPLYPRSKHVYAVTGFKKWGLSTSMVAAKIIQQYINGEKTPEMQLFYTHRLSAPASIPKRLLQEIEKLL